MSITLDAERKAYLTGPNRSGENESDKGQGIVVDGAGHVYVAGYTKSDDFPTQNPWQASRAGSRDAFLVKLDPDAGGSASLLYGTYLGGSSDDRSYAIALGGTNQVYLSGFARSSNFPTANAFDDTFGGGTCGTRSCFDAFVAHLDLDTNSLVYSSYLGGTSDEEGWGIAADSSGNAYVTGYSLSSDFPVLDAIQASKGADGCSAPPCADAFVTKVNASGSSLVYSTYLGGSQEDFGNGIRTDGNGGVFVTGKTLSSDFPTTPGAYDLTLDTAYSDAFVVKINEPAPPPPPTGMSPTYNWHYEYDDLERLTYACSDWDGATSTCLGDNFDYSYDGAGNLLSFSRWDEAGAQVETVRFVYNEANQIACLDRGGNGVCWDPDDVAYSYDAYGNLTGDGIKAYAYDAENRLISVSDGASTTNYTYSGDGDRVSQRVDGVTTSYVIDIATPLTMVLAETTGTETIYYLHGLDLVAQNDGISTEYFGYDGLGSVRQVLESSASVMFAQVFDPYGDPYASAGTASTSWGFTGEQTDTSGLIFLRARYYDPRLGRFVQLDPSRRELNPYQYGLSNPILHADPSGLFSQITNFTLSQFEAMSVDERISWIQDFMALEPQLNNWYNNIEDILNYFKVSRIFGLLNKGGSNSPDKWISWADAGVLQVIQDGYRDYRNRPRYLTPIQIGEDAVELWSLFFDEVIRKNRSDDGVIPFWANAEQQGVEYGRAVADQKVPKSNMHPADVMIIDGFYYLSTTYRYIGKVPNGGDISGSIVFAYVGGKLFGYKGSLLFGCIGALLGDWYVDPRSRVEGWNLGPTGEFAKRMEDLLIAYNELRHPDWSP